MFDVVYEKIRLDISITPVEFKLLYILLKTTVENICLHYGKTIVGAKSRKHQSYSKETVTKNVLSSNDTHSFFRR